MRGITSDPEPLNKLLLSSFYLEHISKYGH
jgi:hypothetical protein